MDSLTIARALHVLAIVHWIGGVSMVTLVILPGLSRGVAPPARIGLFEAIEKAGLPNRPGYRLWR